MCSGEALSSGDEGFVAMALGRLQSSYSFPPLARAQRGERSFSDPQCENLGGYLQGKLRKVPSPRDLSLLHSSTLLLLLLSCFGRVRLCDPTEGSPPGSAVPGILQARAPEWVAISFSNA